MQIATLTSLKPIRSAMIGKEVPLRPTPRDERWYAVYTLPNREAFAQSQLGAQKFRTFLPRCVKSVRHVHQVKTVLAPLFPRYVLIALNLHRDRWRSVNGTRGVSSIVTQNGLPSPIINGVVESMADCCDANEVIHFPDCRPGQSVRVVAGHFAEPPGVLERLASSERVRVLLDFMNCQIAVDLSKNSIAPG